ncbi:MAG: cation diffusion facilitator family transporter [Actinomycetota bacterium]|nr:cation diffusion facilitator family transporter [Actinomycetota bacterium]
MEAAAVSGHGHVVAAGTATGDHRRRLLVVLVITVVVLVAQLVGGVVSGSLALLADAGHMATDAAGLAVALAAAGLAARPATNARTYGLQRAEILAALVNAVLLGGVAIWVLIEAARRWGEAPDVEPGLMLAVATVGAAANLVSLLVLRRGADASLNLRGAYLEVLGDLLGSLAVVAAAVVIVTTGYARADAIASVLIAAMILPRAWGLLRDVLDVLLEATPRGVDLDHVRAHISDVRGVVDVHDLHAWTITSGMPVLSAHVVVDDRCVAEGRAGEVLDELGECLDGHFDVAHCTFQLEPVGHRAHEAAHHR